MVTELSHVTVSIWQQSTATTYIDVWYMANGNDTIPYTLKHAGLIEDTVGMEYIQYSTVSSL